MGCAEALLKLRLAEDEVMVLSGADLKDYYYHYRISRQRLVKNALAGEITEAVARTFSGFETSLTGYGPFRGCPNRMAMGDLNSVEFGQLAHLSLSLRATVFLSGEMLTLRSQAPRTSVAGGVVIDDLVLAARVNRDLHASRLAGGPEGALPLGRAEKAYAEGGLKQNFKKTFREQLHAECWGLPTSTCSVHHGGRHPSRACDQVPSGVHSWLLHLHLPVPAPLHVFA